MIAMTIITARNNIILFMVYLFFNVSLKNVERVGGIAIHWYSYVDDSRSNIRVCLNPLCLK